MERQEGYYWVKIGDKFVIAEYVGGWWFFTFKGGCVHGDEGFEFINENRIKAPGELPD